MPKNQYKGYWWLPGKDAQKIYGILSFNDPKGKATLDLMGTLNSIKKMFSSTDIPLIHGFSADGRQITLHKCTSPGGKMAFPGFPTERYQVQRAFIGVHFNRIEDITFKTFSILYSNASDWVGISGIEQSFSLTEPNDITLKYSPKKIADVEIDKNWRLEILHKAVVSPPKHFIDQTEASIKEKVFFKVSASSEVSFEEFLKKIFLISNFLTLGVGRPIFPLAIEGTTSKAVFQIEQETKSETIHIFFIMAESPDLIKSRTWNEMFFAYGHIMQDFERMIQKWFEKADLLNPVYDLYFGTLYNSSMYLHHEFLSLAQALESYHRRMHGGKYVEDQPYQPIRQTLSSAIPSSLGEDFRESLKTKIKYGNEFSLKKRLREVVDKNSEFIQTLIVDPGEFIDQVANTRNYLTHYTEELRPKAKKGYDLYVLGQKLKFLIEVCFLSELGLPSNVIQKRLKEDVRYKHLN